MLFLFSKTLGKKRDMIAPTRRAKLALQNLLISLTSSYDRFKPINSDNVFTLIINNGTIITKNGNIIFL